MSQKGNIHFHRAFKISYLEKKYDNYKENRYFHNKYSDNNAFISYLRNFSLQIRYIFKFISLFPSQTSIIIKPYRKITKYEILIFKLYSTNI